MFLINEVKAAAAGDQLGRIYMLMLVDDVHDPGLSVGLAIEELLDPTRIACRS